LSSIGYLSEDGALILDDGQKQFRGLQGEIDIS